MANVILLDAAGIPPTLCCEFNTFVGWTQKNYVKTVDHLFDGRIPHNNSVTIGESDNYKIDDKLLLPPGGYLLRYILRSIF